MYNPIKELRQLAINTAVSVYDEDAVTAIELAGRTACKVNECVKLVNTTAEALDKKLDETLKACLKIILTEYYESGQMVKDFDSIINEVVGGSY